EGREEGMAVVWATAYLDEAARCGEVLLLHEGRLLAQGPAEAFLAPLAGREFRVGVPGEQRRAPPHTGWGCLGVAGRGGAWGGRGIVRGDGAAVGPAQKLGGETLEPVPARFEDGFVALLAPPPRPSHAAREREDNPLSRAAGEGRGGGAEAITVTDLVRRF